MSNVFLTFPVWLAYIAKRYIENYDGAKIITCINIVAIRIFLCVCTLRDVKVRSAFILKVLYRVQALIVFIVTVCSLLNQSFNSSMYMGPYLTSLFY